MIVRIREACPGQSTRVNWRLSYGCCPPLSRRWSGKSTVKEEKPRSSVIPRSRDCGFLSKAAVEAVLLSGAVAVNGEGGAREGVGCCCCDNSELAPPMATAPVPDDDPSATEKTPVERWTLMALISASYDGRKCDTNTFGKKSGATVDSSRAFMMIENRTECSHH